MAALIPKPARFGLLATAAAVAVIAAGALWCVAPVWQPGLTLYTEPLPAAAEAAPEAREPINVNTADAETLTALPGIGEAKARAILAYRSEHGPFSSLAELEQVSGISARMVESWQGLAVAGANK